MTTRFDSRNSALLLATLAIFQVLACSSRDARSLDLLAPSDSTETVELNPAAGMCADCFDLRRVLVFGDTIGDGFVNFSSSVIRDSLGRYWVNQRDLLKVFDAKGRYVGEVGRPGQGPMEFSQPLPLQTNGDGDVVIYDPSNGRETIINPDFEMVSEMRFPNYPHFNRAEPMPVAHQYAASIWIATADRLGLPLHIISGDSILTSFGADSLSSKPQTPFEAMRILAIDDSGRIYSAKRFDYEIECWSSAGRRIVRYTGPELNSKPVKPGPYNLEDNPWPSEIVDMQVDRSGRLWVLSWQLNSDWRQLFEPRVLPNGMPGLQLKEGRLVDSVYSSRLDVIDVHRGDIIAQVRADGPVQGFLGQSFLFQNTSRQDGTSQITVWQVLTGSADQL